MQNQVPQQSPADYRKWPRLALTAAALVAGAAPVLSAAAAVGTNPILPPNANAYGSSLADWTQDYWRWVFSGAAGTEPYQPGAARLVFLPIPAGDYLGGDFTSESPGYLQGSIELTIPRGTAFFVPCFAWIAERYNTGQGDDPSVPNELIESVAIHPSGEGAPAVTLDDQPILQDFWSYYVGPEDFDPIVEYPEPSGYGSVAALAYQGVGFVARPMTPGTHTLHLFERLFITNEQLPGYEFPLDLGIIYDNTWIITVE